jgi:hypothetical protein
MNYIQNFQKSRSGKIGASDIPTLIQHPEHYESLAGYGKTPMTFWLEKTGQKEKDPVGFSAHMGHMLEPIILYEWIRNHTNKETAEKFYKGYLLCELDKTSDGYPTAPDTQYTDFLHHTEAKTDFAVAHMDMINRSGTIDVQVKSANYWASRRNDDPYKGYDFDVKGHQGIPLKNYYQVQFEMAVYNEAYGFQIDDAYLGLLCDTSTYGEWHIKRNVRVHERLLEISHYMKKCIDKRIPPKNLIMSKKDIELLYPKLDEDFRIVSGDEMTAALKAAEQANEAAKQQKAWKQTEEDAKNALAIIMKNAKIIKGLRDNEIIDIAGWTERKGSEKIKSLKEIEKEPRLYKYMKRNDLIISTKASRYIDVKLKEE